MNGQIYKFAGFELSLSEGELRSKDSTVRLQEKSLLLLSALLDHPRMLVTREQLRERMWSRDTFVDYEQGINVAIKKVRSALGDSAEDPKYIQTISKKGYRFLLPVEVIASGIASDSGAVSKVLPNYSEQPRLSAVAVPATDRRWIWAGAIGTALLAISAWLVHVQTARAHHSTQIHSLAVLPLRNLSPDPGQEYFADGITEELITNLAQSLPLRVISRTSVMRYKQSNEPMSQIAQELGVEAIIEGAVTRVGNRVIITVQLIDAMEDRHLWARKYDRRLGDLLGLEAEVSQEIASQVGGTLLARQSNPAPPRHVDPKVYELCLMGRYHWNKRTASDLTKSAEYYRQAITLDPSYAPAYAGLANAYALMPSYDSVEWRDAYSKAEEAARQALKLDENMAEARATLGIIDLNGHNWPLAGTELQRALDLNPNYATAHHWNSFFLFFSGRADEALQEIERARQLDPLSSVVNADEGGLFYSLGHYQQAKVRLRRAVELAPDFGQPHGTLALIDLEEGDSSNALKEAHAALALDARNPRTIAEAGYVFAETGHTGDARRLLSILNDMVHRGSATPTYAALIQVGLGERTAALASLERAAGTPGIEGLSQWHPFSQLSSEPRYQKLIVEMPDMKSPNLSSVRSNEN